MVHPPNPWIRDVGGYWEHPGESYIYRSVSQYRFTAFLTIGMARTVSMVTGKQSTVRKQLLDTALVRRDFNQVQEGINHLQGTGWTVNGFMLDLMKKIPPAVSKTFIFRHHALPFNIAEAVGLFCWMCLRHRCPTGLTCLVIFPQPVSWPNLLAPALPGLPRPSVCDVFLHPSSWRRPHSINSVVR